MERRKKGRTEKEGKRMMCGIRKERTIKEVFKYTLCSRLFPQSSFDEEVALQSSLGSSFDTSLKRSLRAAKRQGRLLASPPMCVPEVQERTHTKK